MADFERGAKRKNTVEIKKRTNAPSGTTKSAGITGECLEPADYLKKVQGAYPPRGFDCQSTLLAVNFPPSSTITEIRNFFSMGAPVIRVERFLTTTKCTDDGKSYLVVFASQSGARKVYSNFQSNNQIYGFGDPPRTIYVRPADLEAGWWSGITSLWGNSSAPANTKPADENSWFSGWL